MFLQNIFRDSIRTPQMRIQASYAFLPWCKIGSPHR